MKITVDDFRRVGICPAARNWFARHGLDWRDFLRNGVELERLRATGDQQTMIDRLEAAAQERLKNG
ncbi:hypothetical protein OE699_02030 [Sedimentimonas flavescens]|uniref:Uncharacterized protein n=1 Tax=Sedimentimonas flavescens TaxID=2851012 RepID=A0ABT2ZVF3_9RHOB|nr:hypothetical protein [Sedimentimonas flavescens]MCV2877618.1 hypothetical protein [Sedimentimonas flavescens]